MKITFETLDRGCLVIAEDYSVTPPTFERLAYETTEEAFASVAVALGVGVPRVAQVPRPAAAVAPAPEPEPEADEPEPAPEPAPPTRRIGLMQPKKSAAPAGRRA